MSLVSAFEDMAADWNQVNNDHGCVICFSDCILTSDHRSHMENTSRLFGVSRAVNLLTVVL